MPTSGSVDFNLVSNQIIHEAFDLCGIGSEGEEITADQYQRAKNSLNLIIKHKGMKDHLWVRQDMTVTLVDGQAAYPLTPKPLRVNEVRRKVTNGGIETPLEEWARGTYKDQPNKATKSVPVAYYFDPQRTTGTLYVWPAPSASTASAMTIELTAHRVMDDMDGSADDADLPQEQLRSLVYDLAEELALKYSVRADIRQEITGRAAQYRAEAESWDTEPASLYMEPEYRF